MYNTECSCKKNKKHCLHVFATLWLESKVSHLCCAKKSVALNSSTKEIHDLRMKRTQFKGIPRKIANNSWLGVQKDSPTHRAQFVECQTCYFSPLQLMLYLVFFFSLSPHVIIGFLFLTFASSKPAFPSGAAQGLSLGWKLIIFHFSSSDLHFSSSDLIFIS